MSRPAARASTPQPIAYHEHNFSVRTCIFAEASVASTMLGLSFRSVEVVCWPANSMLLESCLRPNTDSKRYKLLNTTLLPRRYSS